jgi:hypothetical protein
LAVRRVAKLHGRVLGALDVEMGITDTRLVSTIFVPLSYLAHLVVQDDVAFLLEIICL